MLAILEDFCCSAALSCLTLCDLMDCSMPGVPVFHYLLELAQTHVYRVGHAIQLTYLFLAALGLGGCVQAFFGCSEQGLLFSWRTQASHCSGSSCRGAWALGLTGSAVVEYGLSCPLACGIFLDQGLNLCFLHWQTDY